MHAGASAQRDRARTARRARARWPTAPSSTSTSWSSPPASARATSWPATPGSRSASAAASSSTTAAAPPTPAIFAIGECACVGGRIYGLVAPGYAMAEVVADRLARRRRAPSPAPTLSTKLKLLGVDVAQLRRRARHHRGRARGHASTTRWRGVYEKLVVSDDATTLLGGDPRRRRLAVRDAAAAASARPLPGDPVTLTRRRRRRAPASDAARRRAGLLLQRRDQGRRSARPIADHGLHRRRRRQGVHEGRHRLRVVRAAAQELLAEQRRRSQPRRCASTSTHTRAELFDIVAGARASPRSPSSSSGTAAAAAATSASRRSPRSSPASATAHVLDGEQAALQDTNDHFLANIQRNGTYSVVPRIPGGEITPEKLIVIGEVARDFGLYTKITGGQRIDLFGARVEQLPAIWRRLVDAGFESGHAYGKALRTVKSCVGSTWCRYGVQDSVGLAIELELRYRGCARRTSSRPAVSGCARECAEAQSKDFGVIATENGWNLYVGGNGGFRPAARRPAAAGV